MSADAIVQHVGLRRRTAWSGGLVAALACLLAGPAQPASAAPTLSVSPRLAPVGTAVAMSGDGCAAADAVSVLLAGPIVPPGPGGPVTVLPATADATGAWSITPPMPAGTVSVSAICGGQTVGGIVISSDLTPVRAIDVVWVDETVASLTISGGVPTSSVDVLARDGRAIGSLAFDASGTARGNVPIPADVSEVFALGREFLLSEFPSPAAWRAVLPPRPETPPTTTVVVSTTTPGGTSVPVTTATSSPNEPGGTAPSSMVASASAATIPETGAGSLVSGLGVALACCVAGGALAALARSRPHGCRSPLQPGA
ncbi:MAG: hypothetical protein AB7Q42_01090 [Acidimicrobiia bacterium]